MAKVGLQNGEDIADSFNPPECARTLQTTDRQTTDRRICDSKSFIPERNVVTFGYKSIL